MTKQQKLLFVTQIMTAANLLFPTKQDLADAEATIQANTGSAADLTALTNRVSTNETDILANTTSISTLDTTLRDLIATTAAQLGTRVGSANTYAGLPTVDRNGNAITPGDTATLTATDGAYPAGLYEYDGTSYVLQINYDAIDLTNIIANATATQQEVDDGVINNKFVTPATLDTALTQAEVNTAAGV